MRVQVLRSVLVYGGVFLAGGLVSWSVRGPVEDNQTPAPEFSELEAPPASTEAFGSSAPVLQSVREGVENPLVGVIAPAERVDLVAGDGGRLDTLNITLGEVVEKGMLLAEVALEDLDYKRLAHAARLREAEVAIEKAGLRVELARRKWERRQTSQQVFSAEVLEETELELQVALLDLESAEARSVDFRAELSLVTERLARRQIFAPFDGQVTERYVDLGATVSSGQSILQLVPMSGRFIQFAAPSQDFERYSLGTKMQVRLTEGGNEACATIERISPTLDKGSRFVFMAARLTGDTLRRMPFGTPVRVELAEAPTCA